MNVSPEEQKFKNLVKLASQPLQPVPETKQEVSDGYTDKQTRPHKAEDTSAKRSGKSRQSSASAETDSTSLAFSLC